MKLLDEFQGFLFINKPHGITSFECVRHVKHLFGKGVKIGHTGTLDSFARGLLIIAIHRVATRHIRPIMELDKQYTAKSKLGQLTDTRDYTGTTLRDESAVHITQKNITDAIDQLGKRYLQTPPIFSACKFRGKRLSCLARKGTKTSTELQKIVANKAREVQLYNMELISYESPFFTFNAHVSHGTYIRSLANDIAQKIESCATVYELERTAIGPFKLCDAIDLRDLRTLDVIRLHVVPVDLVLECVKNYKL